MKEFKGTKGPWEYIDMDADSISEISSTMIVCGDVVLAVVGPTGHSSLPEDEYNANLIAAAPDLLEELQLTLGALREICFTCGAARPESTIRRAEAAIAKALGETK